jgi:uncharacterized RDD family membrane protein YckC
MRRPDEETEDQLLFDLPLDRPAAASSRKETRTETRRTPAPRPRPAPVPTPAPAIEDSEDDEDGVTDEEPAAAARAGLGSRLAAGAADLLVHAAVLMVLLIGTRLLGVRATLADAPAFGVFLLTFSFLYTIVPLAFWGHTLGMAWTGLVAQNRDGEPLTFDQTARRWLGAVLTLAAVGLPLLLALGGRSLADLLSGSVTWSDKGGEAAEPEAA